MVFALIAARLLVTAWKPDLILATEHLEPHDSHCRKNKRVSFCKMVSGERQVWQVTYSLMYLLKTFSICLGWKRPLMINCWLPSIEPLVPNSANKKSNKCLGCLWRVLQMSVKLANDVFFVPTRSTCGGLITNLGLRPPAMSGFLSRMISKTLFNNSS